MLAKRLFSKAFTTLACTGLLLLGIVSYCQEKPLFQLSENLLKKVEEKHGTTAKNRLLFWQNLIQNNQQLDEKDKLEAVNDFFNDARFTSDMALWKQKDYWATPVEFLIRDAGDCEDYSIAKYFTLRELGVPGEKLRITYVTATRLNQAHMVLAYYPTPSSQPLILDNLNRRIKPASERTDLIPVYSFNAESLWLSRSRNESQHSGSSEQIKAWSDLTRRIKESAL
ncbi:transglutaminase-like cysteine peptidase [Porticoccus sp. W117]|uniref:transglutaminase-like cysteine peptidase n=1 Tax=Porticoccus sp. W117 TaxID=3054777 RepID=UPI00259529A4|nr:transglutaminase-like cysteine peptidase [Porticoccus sp. W117]MDM3872662.1 transglutaminase-like cysteine peptidase [Porticoccus sp. W117]